MSALTKDQKDEFKAVKQYPIMKGLINHVANLTYDNMAEYQEDLIAKDLLDYAYGEEPESTQEPPQDAENNDNSESAQDDSGNAENGNQDADSTDNTGTAEIVEDERHEAWELSETLETVVLTIPQSEMPVKPSYAAFLQDDGEPDFEAYKAAMDIYKGALSNNTDKEIKRIIGNHNGLILPIIIAVLKRIGKQGVYVGGNGFIKWYDEPLKQELSEGKTSKDAAEKDSAPVQYIIDGTEWTGRGQMLAKLLDALKKDNATIRSWSDDRIRKTFSENYAKNNYSKADHELVRQVAAKYKV
jgi:hypothetical protein